MRLKFPSFCSSETSPTFSLMAGEKKSPIRRRDRAAIVVLGDIGRSPRMQYHALSLARQAFLEVDIVAYGGSEPHTAVLENSSIHIHKMPQWPTSGRSLLKILRPLMLMLKPIVQFLLLLWYICMKIPAPDAFIVQLTMFVLERASQLNFIGWISMVVLGHPGLILFTGSLIGSQLLKCLLSLTLRTRLLVQICDFDLQNPPSVPTLVGVKWASWSRHSTFIVDWHNFGYTLLALSLGRSSLFVSLYRWIEKQYGKMAHGSLCVTRAMQHELAENWGIK